MKNILMQLHISSRLIFVFGWIAVVTIVLASAVLHFGAGSLWDYYSSVALSEKLLTMSRPASVAVCSASLLTEYRIKKT